MKKTAIRYLSSVLLMGALTAPLAVQAQDRDDHKDRDANHRIYDRQHKDYHQWNDDEDRAYRQWYTEKKHGKSYRDYNRLSRKDQNAYWNWRHQHDDRH